MVRVRKRFHGFFLGGLATKTKQKLTYKSYIQEFLYILHKSHIAFSRTLFNIFRTLEFKRPIKENGANTLRFRNFLNMLPDVFYIIKTNGSLFRFDN